MTGNNIKGDRHVLYRFFDADSRLLYVGITNNPSRRFSQHEDVKPWWSEVTHIRIEVHQDRASVLAAERTAVATENPKHNIQLRNAMLGRLQGGNQMVKSSKDVTIHNRVSDVEERGLDRASLVGSFFHGQGGRFNTSQGCVVAEPSPGVYLCEFFSWLAGESTHQRLVPIEEMSEWLFYDTAKWMNNAYEYGGVARQWERDREQAEAS